MDDFLQKLTKVLSANQIAKKKTGCHLMNADTIFFKNFLQLQHSVLFKFLLPVSQGALAGETKRRVFHVKCNVA